MNFDELDNIHIPAAIVKSFLRQLPEPLLTYDLYDHIIHVQCTSFTADISVINKALLIISYYLSFVIAIENWQF